MQPLTPTTPTNLTLSIKSDIVQDALSVLNTMKAEISTLTEFISVIDSQTGQIDGFEAAEEVVRLTTQVHILDKKLDEGIEEINLIYDDLKEKKLKEYAKKQVEATVQKLVDELVREQVASVLREYIPQELQDEVAESKQQLEDLRKQLHNSESRRANEALRIHHRDSLLRPIYKADGEVSKNFPKTLGELFALEADMVKTLVEEYEIPEVSDIRDRNLNRFMQFCGVLYQIV